MARVKVPYRFSDQIYLSELIIKKHLEEGNRSILNNLMDMDAFEEHVLNAKKYNDERDKLMRMAERETELRNNEWKDGDANVRSIAQFLKTIYKKNPHELGEWGFVVDSSPQKKKD